MRVERLARWVARLATASSLLCVAAIAQAQPAPQRVPACEACHGPGGNSQVPETPAIAAQPKLFIENQLVLMREGLREVPQMKDVLAGISDEDIIALARHFAAQPLAPRSTPVQPDKYRLGAQLSKGKLCGTCHLGNYTGQQQVPRLAGQNEAYLLFAMKQFRDHPGPGRDTIMSASLFGLKDDELDQLAHYLSHYAP
jgi:cytochrome c553